MSDISRSEHIESLKLLLDFIENNNLFTLADSISQSLRFAIDSLEVDEAYQIMYEGGEISTKDEVIAMLNDLADEISSLTMDNDPLDIANYIREKINTLKEQEDGGDD